MKHCTESTGQHAMINPDAYRSHIYLAGLKAKFGLSFLTYSNKIQAKELELL